MADSDGETEGVSQELRDADYIYTVKPAGKMFTTRHEAVGFAAVHGRKHTYYRMNSIDTDPIPLRIEIFEND